MKKGEAFEETKEGDKITIDERTGETKEQTTDRKSPTRRLSEEGVKGAAGGVGGFLASGESFQPSEEKSSKKSPSSSRPRSRVASATRTGIGFTVTYTAVEMLMEKYDGKNKKE